MSTPDLPIGVEDITAAHRRLRGLAIETPVVASAGLRERAGAEVGLKLESLQPTGSFKVRGAASRMRAMSPAALHRGVVTASTGNHGRAVAYIARALGSRATICVSVHVPPGKLAALQALGCEVIVGGASQTEAMATATQLVDERGMTLVHPFDDPLVIAGQGTIGLETLAQAPATSTLLVPLSGGGLLAGIAVAVGASPRRVRIVGVAMERAAVMARSLAAGEPVDLPEEPTLADSLQGGIGLDNATTFPIVRSLMDEVVLLTEQQIWDGMRFAFDEHRLILEGGAAVGIAALLAGHVDVSGDEQVIVVCSGANAEPEHVIALAEGRTTPPE